MLDEPADLHAQEISAGLRDYWGIVATDVSYLPMGHGSCNWVAEVADGLKWFIKADHADSSAFHQAAYRTASELHDAGLGFVHAAIRDRAGVLRRRISPTWELAVFPFIHGRNPDFRSSVDRTRIADAVGRLHAHVPVPAEAMRWSPGFRQAQLRDLLANELDRPWTEGPYGEGSRALITESVAEIEELFRLHDRLVERLFASDERWVITHGEPHGGNTMLDTAGQMHLIDCDDMMLAPRERDLWLLLYVDHQRPAGLDNESVIEAYRRRAGPVEPRRYVLELYRADWHLREISAYGAQFSGPHENTADVQAHWQSLNSYLPIIRNWPAICP